jgi:hypothetical protein
MDYKNNVDILTWKRVIQNLQEKTDESANSYNEAQISMDDQDNIETEHYNVVVSSNDNGIIVDVYDKHDPQKEPIKSDQYWDEDVMESKEKVTEGTWSIPDTPEKVRELKDLMKQELPADEAQDKIYGILGDDELFDDIAEMEEKDPKADVRGMIVRRLDDLGLIKKKVNETTEALTEEQFDEAAGEKDACYHKVKARYKIWPSAYASGALTQCRKKGAKNWGNSKK